MSEQEFAVLDVAVTVIKSGKDILAVYNPNWDSFTLPMTKRRHWEDADAKSSRWYEEWIDAAARAAAQWLGQTTRGELAFLLDLANLRQGDRDGTWKRYHFRVFALSLKERPKLMPGAITEWLTRDDFIDENRRPISPTARRIIGDLKSQGLL